MSLAEVAVDSTLAAALEARGLQCKVGDILVLVSQAIDAQWFVENPAVVPENEATWVVLTSPERRQATRDTINEALRELRQMRDHLQRQVRLAHQGAQGSKILRDALPFTTADTAARVGQVEQIMATLSDTKTRLERIHLTYTRRTT